MTKPPPLTATAHELPFDRLSPRDFERLCLSLVRLEIDRGAEHVGAAGSDGGRDIRAVRNGRTVVFQCKRVREFGPKAALAAVGKVLALPREKRPGELVLMVACDVSDKVRTDARNHAAPMECRVLALTELDDHVRAHPKLVKRFFGWQAIVRRTGRQALAALVAILALLLSAVAVRPALLNPLAGTSVAILPITAATTQPSAAQSQGLTSRLAGELHGEAHVKTLPPDLLRPLAATLAGAASTCPRPAILEQIRRFTGADYLVTGSFDTFQDSSPKTLTVCLQRTREPWPATSFRQDLPPGGGQDALREIARRLAAKIWIRPSTLFGSRHPVYTRDFDAARQYFDGMLHFQRFELQEALESFKSAVARDPGFYPAYDGWSRVAQELGHDPEAQDAASKALTAFERLSLSDQGERSLLEARLFVTQGRWDLALGSYDTLWRQPTVDMATALGFVETLNMAGRGRDARAKIQEVRARQARGTLDVPLETDVHLDIEESIAEGRAGLFDRQAAAAERALRKLGPNQDFLKSRARFLLCDAEVSRSKTWPDPCLQAVVHFRSVGDRINYGKFRQLEARHWLKLGGQANELEALAIDREVTRIFDNSGFQRGYIDQLINLVDCLLWQHPPLDDEARRKCQDATLEAQAAKSPGLPAVLINCASLPTMARQFEQAATAYREALNVATQRGDSVIEAVAAGNLAYVEHAVGRMEEALRLYQRSLQISAMIHEQGQEFGFTLIRYARLLSDLGRAQEAAATFERGKREAGASRQGLSEFLASMTEVLPSDPPAWRRITSGQQSAANEP
jgi:tetratricopeptide (TPR) repeat protein